VHVHKPGSAAARGHREGARRECSEGQAVSWWGKVLGGTVGFVLGGPLGALLGGVLGHGFDEARQAGGLDHTERRQAVFFSATFSVLGHLAKADGQVSRDEIRLASRVMDRLGLAPHLRDFARRLFGEGKRADLDLDAVLTQLAHEAPSRDLLRMFLEIQVFAAYADGRVHPAERAILERICAHLGFDAATLAQVEHLVQAELQHEFSAGTSARAAPLDDAYAVLGIAHEADDAAVKRAYRRLMSQHHPDKLVAKGLPEEMMTMATARAQEIRGAYERVKIARGMR
jgi:DnaJ like chaperone protein